MLRAYPELGEPVPAPRYLDSSHLSGDYGARRLLASGKPRAADDKSARELCRRRRASYSQCVSLRVRGSESSCGKCFAN